MKDLLKDFFKRAGFKFDTKTIAAESFFVLQGIFTGVALNDIWRMLSLPGNNAPIGIVGKPGLFDQDYLYQLGFAGIAAVAQIFFKVEHGIPFAAGIFLGSTWANLSEGGHYIGAAGALNKPPVIPPGTPQVQPVVNPVIIQQPTYAPSIGGTPAYNPMATVTPNAPHLGIT